MKTEADKKVEDVKMNTNSSIRALGAIIIDQCEGSSDYTKLYLLTLKAALQKLIEIRDDLLE